MAHDALRRPRRPSPRDLAGLGAAHLFGDGLLRGARVALQCAAEYAKLPSNLAEQLDNWHTGGHFGAIGDAAYSLVHGKRPPISERVYNIRRAAVAVAVAHITGLVATGPNPTRTPENTQLFLENTTYALVGGKIPEEVAGGPVQQLVAYKFAEGVGLRLGFDDARQREQRDAAADAMLDLTEQIVARVVESGEPTPHPDRLMEIAEHTGRAVSDLAGAAVLGPGSNPHPSMGYLGRMGGVVEYSSPVPTAGLNGLHTYASASILAAGGNVALGAARAASMREERVLVDYNLALVHARSGAERHIVETVGFFVANAYSHP